MINPNETNMNQIDCSREVVDQYFVDLQDKMWVNKARVYANHKKVDFIQKEEQEVIKEIQGSRKNETYFATKITDTVFVVEWLYHMKTEEKDTTRSYFYPYVKGLNIHHDTAYKTFEEAAIAALMYSAFPTVNNNDNITFEHRAAVMTTMTLVDNL